MDRPQFLTRVVEWLRAGYPDGVPQGDYIPLVALLRRQLSAEEVEAVSADLIRESAPPPEPISKIDAGVKITKVTHEMPYEADIDRVRQHLETAGWPFDNHPLDDGIIDTEPTPDENTAGEETGSGDSGSGNSGSGNSGSGDSGSGDTTDDTDSE